MLGSDTMIKKNENKINLSEIFNKETCKEFSAQSMQPVVMGYRICWGKNNQRECVMLKQTKS